MTFTTLCYLIKEGKYLMLHRTKKQQDINAGKYIGVGGHVEEGESPADCIRREIYEETGVMAGEITARGFITFVMGDVTEHTFLYTCDDFTGEMRNECDEGELRWVDIDKVLELNLWEGDKVFLELLNTNKDFFTVKLIYDCDDNLIDYFTE